MTGKTFVQITQKSLTPKFVGAFAIASLLGAQAALAQADGEAVEITMPDVTIPAAAPLDPTLAPVIIEPVQPTDIVPTSIDTGAAESDPVNYGSVFVDPGQQSFPPITPLPGAVSTNDALPEVELISPADYGSAQIDPTDYSIGATMPEVVISERASGCEFSVKADSNVAKASCADKLADAGIPNQSRAGQSEVGPSANVARTVVNLPGVQQVAGIAVAASRDYYNRAAKAMVDLQLGETFIFPLSMPAPLTSLFGFRIHPIFGDERFHTGSDLGAPLGTSVVATQAGRVDFADVAGGYGLMVVLRHYGNTLESRYAHLARLLVTPGEWVEQGEVIGLVGSTGNSTGPHLHFELRQRTADGWAILNPDPLLQRSLGTLSRAMGNSVTALVGKETVSGTKPSKPENVSAKGLPFRPAQPHAN